MKYILKYFYPSKYFGFKRYKYKEFEKYEEIMIFISDNKIKFEDYEIFGKIIY